MLLLIAPRLPQILRIPPGMAVDKQRALLFGGAAALRLLLLTVFPGLPNLLAGRVEVSTPVTSFKRCTLPVNIN